jgi:hemerythrin-like domain-containing protein
MLDPIKAWHDDHAHFSRLLNVLEGQVAAFREGLHPNYDLVRSIVYYLRHYCDRFHHPREDVAFARLVEREPAMRSSVTRLLQEHRVIAAAGETLMQLLDDIVAEVVEERSKLEAAAATYLVYYRHHLATEEAEVLPRAAQVLTKADWAAVAKAVPAAADPVFGEETEARFQELRRHIAIEAQAH